MFLSRGDYVLEPLPLAGRADEDQWLDSGGNVDK